MKNEEQQGGNALLRFFKKSSNIFNSFQKPIKSGFNGFRCFSKPVIIFPENGND
jgi:hypothetical protein